MEGQWQRIYQNLHKLNCPFMSYISSAKVLLDQGEVRNTVMSWLFSLYDNEWMRKLETKELSELSSLTQMASSMGLCSPNDSSFVQGGGSHNKQLVFWQTLIDLVTLREEITPNLDSQTFSQIDFMDNISRESKDIFREQPFKTVFPIPFTAKTEIPDLEASLALLTSQINDLHAQLAQVSPYSEDEHTYTDEFCDDVARSLRDACSVLGNFSEVSEKDFQPWIQSHPNKAVHGSFLGNLPDVIKSCLTVIQLLEDYKTINTSNAQLREHMQGNGSDDNTESKMEVFTSTLNTRIVALNMYSSNKKKR